MFFYGPLFVSFLLVALGQPARLAGLGPLAAAVGFALFWRAMLQIPSRRRRVGLAFSWFTVVQLVQLSWMSSTQYMGALFILVYLGLAVGLGGQFALLSFFIRPSMRVCEQLALSGLWVFFEWIRLFVCSGFTWNPLGLFLSCCTYSLQMASLFGIYGLSFWVLWTNLAGLQVSFRPKAKKPWVLFGLLAVSPYLFGAWHIYRLDSAGAPELRAVLVQPGLLPERKEYDASRPDLFVPLAEQWKRILQSLKPVDGVFDVIVLPEGALPYGAFRPLYDLKVMETIWEECFGLSSIEDLPPLEAPYARLEKGRWKVSNAYWAQALASYSKADVIIGLDDEHYNAAFCFRPGLALPQRYEKQILVPVSEYMPLSGVRLFTDFIAREYGITEWFSAGEKVSLFQGIVPLSVSICYEETYGELVRKSRLQGAELFVNLTNDAWFPSSMLAQQHFDHGMIRAVENGVPVLRACNTGITGGIDRFGRVVRALQPSESEVEVLEVALPMQAHETWYTKWGDAAILWISGLCVFLIALNLSTRLPSSV